MKKETYTVFLALFVGILVAVFGMKIGVTVTGFASSGLSNSTANATNVAPVVSSVTVNGGSNIDLNAGTTKTVTCTGVISDDNGYDDISSASAVFYQSTGDNTASYNSADDYNNHYTDSSCTLTSGYDTTKKNVTCTFSLEYFADPATWTCNITATDASSATGSDSHTATVNSIVAVDVDGSIDFGAMAAGATSATGVAENLRNYGNVVLDMSANGTDMSCTTRGAIPVGNIHLGTSASADYTNDMLALSTSPQLDNTFDLNFKQDQNLATYSYGTYYLKVKIPIGAKGECSGTIQFTASESTNGQGGT